MMQNSFENTVANVAKALNDAGSPPILVGGWAVNLFGVTRQTLDFDMMIFQDLFDIVKESLEKSGYQMQVKTKLYARFENKNAVIELIDTLFADERTYNILSNGTEENICGGTFILPKKEHLIAMKLHAVKYGESHRGSKDFQDITDMIKANDIDVYTDDFKQLCLKYGEKSIYKRIKNECKTTK